MSEINYFDQNPNQEVEDDFKDQPDEIEGKATPDGGWQAKSAPLVEGPAVSTRPQRPTNPTVKLPQAEQEVEESIDEETDSEVLTDARFRLEQGRLYEMVLNHDIFDGVEADKRAIKSVQNEIRAYAQERMEIMLGMRQEKQESNTNAYEAFSEIFPFNSLEVEALKSLAAAATKGASRDAAPLEIGPQPPAPRTTLNPIGRNSGATRPVAKQPVKKALPAAPKAPVQRQKVDSAVQRILEEEGVTLEEINQVFDPRKKYLSPEELAQLTPDQVIERNKAISARNRTVSNPHAIPMPTPEQIEAMVVQRANQAAANPQMKTIMGLLDEAAKRKG